jgi:hypothetical protein
VAEFKVIRKENVRQKKMQRPAVLKGAEPDEGNKDFEENSSGGSSSVRRNIKFS